MPASAHAARIASSAMSYTERPSARENGVCPMPTIAARSRISWFNTTPPAPGGSAARGVGGQPRDLVPAEAEAAREDGLGVGAEARRRRRRGEHRAREADGIPA